MLLLAAFSNVGVEWGGTRVEKGTEITKYVCRMGSTKMKFLNMF
jgi:hypothetical protein